ncbi:hypothetical protein [Streptomyces scabiei]|uniref:hypothetical protein n=1 Tax=Streptomyces scabiei TaxID=1930 RepID=UPI002FF15BB3
MAVFQDVERMRDVDGLTADVSRDAATRRVALRHGGEDRVIERRVPDVGLLGEQITRLTEKGAERREDGTADPVVEGGQALGNVVRQELAAIRGRTADDSVQSGCEGGVLGHAPELRGGPIPEGPDDQFELRPAPEGGRTRQQPTHDRHRRTAKE